MHVYMQELNNWKASCAGSRSNNTLQDLPEASTLWPAEPPGTAPRLFRLCQQVAEGV